MIENYCGHFLYNKQSICISAPVQHGVYYCGYIDGQRILQPLYIGRALGDEVSIRSRLLEHLGSAYWPDVTSFGFQICTTKSEAEQLEQNQIRKFKPKYNLIGK